MTSFCSLTYKKKKNVLNLLWLLFVPSPIKKKKKSCLDSSLATLLFIPVPINSLESSIAILFFFYSIAYKIKVSWIILQLSFSQVFVQVTFTWTRVPVHISLSPSSSAWHTSWWARRKTFIKSPLNPYHSRFTFLNHFSFILLHNRLSPPSRH